MAERKVNYPTSRREDIEQEENEDIEKDTTSLWDLPVNFGIIILSVLLVGFSFYFFMGFCSWLITDPLNIIK